MYSVIKDFWKIWAKSGGTSKKASSWGPTACSHVRLDPGRLVLLTGVKYPKKVARLSIGIVFGT